MPITNVLAEIAVTDLDSVRAWYERLLGRPADRFPMDGLIEWQVTEAGGIQLFRDADHAGAATLTLIVDDLEAHIADLAGKGLTDGVITRGEKVQFIAITDPEGNTITFAELLSSAA